MEKPLKLLSRLGALPQQAVLWTITLALCGWIALDAAWLRLSSGLALASYDGMVRARLWAPAPDPRIVIADIDEAALAAMAPEFGRWPWPRDTLATVLTWLEQQGVAAIVWDIAFTDPDRHSPGGDAAFDAAARASPHSLFPVIRLPASGDAHSELTQAQLPQLWLQPGQGRQGVALVPPAFAGLAAGKLGYNNARPDADGVLRHYRHFERLPDGGVLQSMALAVARSVDPEAGRRALARVQQGAAEESLLAWPGRGSSSYPRVSFHRLFQAAEGQGQAPLPLAGRIVLVGSTAPSLHDIHPTPRSAVAPGVETLASAIDDALHQRHRGELSPTAQAAGAIGLCLLLAWHAARRSVASLDPLLFALPALLLAVSFASLHVGPLFLDLQLAASFSLLLMALLRGWNQLRRNHFWAPPEPAGQPLLLWAWRRPQEWDERAMDRLLDVLRAHAPACRVVPHESQASWPGKLRWPELAGYLALVGPADALAQAHAALDAARVQAGAQAAEPVRLPPAASRAQVAQATLQAWAGLAREAHAPAQAGATTQPQPDAPARAQEAA